REEFVEGHAVADLDAIRFQEFLIVPKDVSMMDAGQYRVGLSIFGHQVHESFWKRLFPASTLVELGNWVAIAKSNILAKQFPAGMTLPGVRRIVDRQPRLEDRASARTASARDGRI